MQIHIPRNEGERWECQIASYTFLGFALTQRRRTLSPFGMPKRILALQNTE